MARAGTWAIVAVVATSALSGCGTLMNLGNAHPGYCPLEVYGGVRWDVENVAGFVANPFSDSEGPVGLAENVVLASLLLAVDLPLCVVADTLTLPITIPLSRQKGSADDPQAAPEVHAEPGHAAGKAPRGDALPPQPE